MHLEISFRPLAALDPVGDLLLPGSLVGWRGLPQYKLAVDRHLLQRAKQDASFHARRGSSVHVNRKPTYGRYTSAVQRR